MALPTPADRTPADQALAAHQRQHEHARQRVRLAQARPLTAVICRACGVPVERVIKTFPAPGGGTFERRCLIDASGRNHFATCPWAEANALERVEAMVGEDPENAHPGW